MNYCTIKWIAFLLAASSFALICLIVFLFCLYFYILTHFKIVGCIVKSLITTSKCFFVEILMKENLKCFLGATVWMPKSVYCSPKRPECHWQMKEMTSMSYDNSISSWKPWRCMSLDIYNDDWYFRWERYTSIPAWTNSQNWAAITEELSLNISSPGRSLKCSQRLSQSAMEYSQALGWQGASYFEFEGKSIIKQHDKNFPVEQKPLQDKY